MLDDVTPREVWEEYRARKLALALHLFSPSRYQREFDQLADDLGLGIPRADLTEDQREAQRIAIARHGGTGCDQ